MATSEKEEAKTNGLFKDKDAMKIYGLGAIGTAAGILAGAIYKKSFWWALGLGIAGGMVGRGAGMFISGFSKNNANQEQEAHDSTTEQEETN